MTRSPTNLLVKNGRYKPLFYPFEGEGKKRTGSRFFFRSFEGFDIVGHMTDGFVRKKVESLTLGEKLKKLRQQYRMSYAEIAKATRIQAKYLESLENGEYEKLPAEVYVRGFLKSYARHLGLNDDAFLKLYDKEKDIRENLGQESAVQNPVRYPTMNAWIITPRTVLIVLLMMVLGGTFFYLFSEFRSFVAEPRLSIAGPLPGAIVDGSMVELHGQTDPGAMVTANGEPVYVTADGKFSEELTLQQGLNRIAVRATNRFEKTREEIVTIESRVVFNSVAASPDSSGFDIAVRALSKPISVTIMSGEEVLYSGTLSPGKEERFSGLVAAIQLTTDNGRETEVILDGGPPERVGEQAIAVSGKTYLGRGINTKTPDPVSTNP